MGFIEFNEKLVSRLDLPLNSFETKAVGFCKRAADVVVVQFFEWMNSIKFIVIVLAKHWT